MPKLTSEILLKKGNPKSSSLKELKKLNLSKMHLETKDVDPKLFSRMINLEELDVSGNLLSEIPCSLMLHNLRVLNFRDNQVEDITVLKEFPNLEEVIYEENMYLTISDNHKVFCLLPKLKRLNNKDITSLANHVRFVNHRELNSRVEAYWEKNYKDKFLKETSLERVKAVRKDFKKNVVDHVRYGPNSLKDFTKWKVQLIAENLLSSILDSNKNGPQAVLEQSCADSDTFKALPSSVTKKRVGDHPAQSPRKKFRITEEIASVNLSPQVSKKRQEGSPRITPIKQKPTDSPQRILSDAKFTKYPTVALKSTPSKKPTTTGKTSNTGKQNIPQKHIITKELDVEPLHILQCHSKNNRSDDFRTQLWACAFEPDLDNSSSRVIATCGGDSICVIDCETGKVMKKYKVIGEEFFTLAWTTLTMITKAGQKRKINILAAGGKLGVIKLIHPNVSLAYGDIKAHKKAISIMSFSPKQETFLFTGSYDKRILLWDIGVPDFEYNFRASQLLTLDTSSTPLRICPVPAYPDQYLMAACEDGCFVYDIKLTKNQGKRSHEAEFNFPVYKKETKKAKFHLVDGLAFLNEDLIASKSALQGSIYIWSWEQSFKTKKSKGNKELDAVILAELKWSNTDLPYLTLSASFDMLCIFCGDEAGKVWIYNLESCKEELINGTLSHKLKDPTKHLTLTAEHADVTSSQEIRNPGCLVTSVWADETSC
uniref:Leucine-rich repeat and WD repeat-containing protein 1 n=1 Tax=Leptobrachium leishanense TaxID=445787 RepID=A0A8C5M6L3_9ANUR